MEANLGGRSNGGDGHSRQEPAEKQWTDEQLTIIHAAMMEELGIGRKDTLPLEDKGPKIHIPKPVKKQIDDDPNDPTAKWRSLQFDDVDPAAAEIDSMYDGQLYRLRRGTSGNAYHQGLSGRSGQSPGRVRGGGASRGGHGFTNDRRGSSRGGRSPGHMGHRTDTANVAPPHRSAPTPKIFINDARRAVNTHARIDAAIARLRALPTPETIASEKKKTEAKAARQAEANGLHSRRSQATNFLPMFALASQDAFLAYAGFNESSSPKPSQPSAAMQESPLPSSPNVTSRELHEAPLAPVKLRLPQPSITAERARLQTQPPIQRNFTEEKSKATQPDLASKENQRPALKNGEVGLSGSKWNSTGPVAPVTRTPSMTASPSSPPPELPKSTLPTSGRSILRENVVKVTKGRGGITRGTARLVKNNPEDRYFNIELVIEGNPVLNQEVLDDDLWKLERTVVTYRAKRVEDESAPMPSTTWSITFQMPYQANNFYNLVLCNLTRRNNQPQGNTEAQPITSPESAALNQPTAPVEKSAPVTQSYPMRLREPRQKMAEKKAMEAIPDNGHIQQPNVPEPSPLNIPQVLPAFNTPGQVSQQLTSVEYSTRHHLIHQSRPSEPSQLNSVVNECTQNIAAATAEISPMAIPESYPIPQEEAVMGSSSPQRIPSPDWPFQPISDPSSAGLLDRYHPGGTGRISSQAFTDMTEVAGLETLISFDHDEPKIMPTYVREFLDLDDTKLMQTTFDYFQSKPNGTFLDQLSAIVAKDNVAPASQLTGTEILLSQKYHEAAENLVGDRLSHSETFAMLPDMVQIHYTTEKTRKLLEMAVALRDQENVATRNVIAYHSAQVIEQPLNLNSDSQQHAETDNSHSLEQAKTAHTTSTVNSKPDTPRITYSAEDLLGLRKNASTFRSERVSNEVAHHIVRPSGVKPIDPVNITRTTKNSIPIIDGHDGVSRQPPRGSIKNPNFKSTKSVAAWQAYSVTESGDEPATLSERPLDIPTLNTRPENQINPAPFEQAAVLRASSANNFKASSPSKNEPAMSPKKPANIPQVQETDMALWGALLTTVKDKKQDPSRVRALSNNSKSQMPQTPSRGLNLNKEPEEEPSTPKPQLVAAFDVYKAASQFPINDQARPASTSSVAMTEKIKEALMTPLSLVPRPSPRMVTPQPHPQTNEAQAVTNSTKSNFCASISSTPILVSAKPKSISEVKTESSMTVQISSEVQSTPVSTPMNLSCSDVSVKVESTGIMISSTLPGKLSTRSADTQAADEDDRGGKRDSISAPIRIRRPAEPSSTSEVEPTNTSNPRSERPQVPDPENMQRPALGVQTDSETTKITAPAPQVPEKTFLFLENVTNKDLKGAPGLSASKWASGSTDQEFESRAHPPGGRTPVTMSTMPVFSPIMQAYPYTTHAYPPQMTIENVPASPPPIYATMASTPPALQTVLIPDPLRPRHYMQVTGISTSQGTPPLPSMMSSHRRQENIPYGHQTSPVSFAPRTDVYRGHRANNSSGSDGFTPGCTPFTPSRGRGDTTGNSTSRPALSPVRQGENVQAKLQSRLNNSLAGRSPNPRG